MGASGYSIRFQPLQGASPAPLSELQPALWEVLADYIWRFTSGAETVWNGYLSDVGPGERWFDSDDESMTFWFPDFAGCCSRSAGLGYHWLEIAVAANFEELSSTAQDAGWLPVGDVPDLRAIVWDASRRYAWISADSDMLEFSFEADDDDDHLFGDDRQVSLADLSDEAQQAVREAREAALCPCAMCTMLRPDPSFESSMLDSLEDPNPDVRMTAVWYLRQAARAGLETALAVTRQDASVARDHAAVCFDFGRKLATEDAGTVLDALQDADDPTERSGLLGLAAGMKLEDDVDVERRLFTFVSALANDPPVREVAAEYAGYGQIAAGREDHFGKGLVGQIGTSDEYDHNVALTLFNFYAHGEAVPRFAIDAITKLAGHESEQVRTIAEFARMELSTRPTRD